jgi:hypothetical protein
VKTQKFAAANKNYELWIMNYELLVLTLQRYGKRQDSLCMFQLRPRVAEVDWEMPRLRAVEHL